jgi:hypothetical protein
MRTLIEILASVAILANAVIYGTDVFGAIVLPPRSPPSTIPAIGGATLANSRPAGTRSSTASRRLWGSEPAALITTRNRPRPTGRNT